MSNCSATHGLEPTRLFCPWDSPDKNRGSGLPVPSPGDLPDPGIEPESPAWAGRFFATESPGKPLPVLDSYLKSFMGVMVSVVFSF